MPNYPSDNPLDSSPDNPPTDHADNSINSFTPRVKLFRLSRTAKHSRTNLSLANISVTGADKSYPSTAPMKPTLLRYSSLIACALITVISVLIALMLVNWSSVRRTRSITGNLAQRPIPLLSPPHAWQIIWKLPTKGAAVADGNVVITQTAHAVQGRDPFDGHLLWEYLRSEPLCQVLEFEDYIIANFRDRRGCGDVTALYAENGSRYATRSSSSDPDAQMTNTGDYVLSLGSTKAELWQDALLRLFVYGKIAAPVDPNAQPRRGCQLISGTASHAKVAILEKCPHEEFDRLTILKSQPTKEGNTQESNAPEEIQSRALPILGTGIHSKVLLTSEKKTLIVISHNATSSELVYVQSNDEGTLVPVTSTQKFSHPLGPSVSSSSTEYSYWVNGQTIIFDRSTFAIKRIIPHTLGAGVDVNDTWYIPISQGELMVNDNRTQTYPFQRTTAQTVDDQYISSDTDGYHIFEVLAGTLIALKPV